LLFISSESPNQPWKSDVLTKALKNLSQDVCDAAFDLQVYRQLSIAPREKHVKQISRLFNGYDDKSASVDIEVAFAW